MTYLTEASLASTTTGAGAGFTTTGAGFFASQLGVHPETKLATATAKTLRTTFFILHPFI